MCSASLVLLVDFLYPLDAVPCHYFSGGGDFTSRLAGLHSYSNARRSISSAAGARSGRSGEDDCSMNSDDGGADGSTNSPVCKRRPAQSSDGGAVRSASSTATGKPWGQPTKALSVLSQAGQTASDISKLRRAGKSVESRFG